MYDLIIIGGGPAGLAAAVHGLRQHLDVLVIGNQMGGRIGWRLDVPWLEKRHNLAGEEVVRTLKAELQLRHLSRVLDLATGITPVRQHFCVSTTAGDFEARTLLIATGAAPLRLHVPGEETFYLRGLAYSAMTYASAMLDRTVAVVGDGSLALRSAAELARSAACVYLVANDPACRVSAWGRRLADLPHLNWLCGHRVEAIQGQEYVEQIVVRNPQGAVETLKVNAVFVTMGLRANSDLAADLVQRDGRGRILVDNRNRTSCPGIFAAGDVTDVYAEQALVAIGEGIKAALSVAEFLTEVRAEAAAG